MSYIPRYARNKTTFPKFGLDMNALYYIHRLFELLEFCPVFALSADGPENVYYCRPK